MKYRYVFIDNIIFAMLIFFCVAESYRLIACARIFCDPFSATAVAQHQIILIMAFVPLNDHALVADGSCGASGKR